jgi:hypothetical protein
MLNRSCADSHHLRRVAQPVLHFLQYGFMFPSPTRHSVLGVHCDFNTQPGILNSSNGATSCLFSTGRGRYANYLPPPAHTYVRQVCRGWQGVCAWPLELVELASSFEGLPQ